MSAATRRVVTGIGPDGKSCVIVDGPMRNAGAPGSLEFAWYTPAVPADNSSSEDIDPPPFSFDLMQSGATLFVIATYPPSVPQFWHATDTIDYISMLEGEITLELEAGPVTIRAGDVLVDRGVIHSWRNDSGKPARAAIVMVPAKPVGQGRTV